MEENGGHLMEKPSGGWGGSGAGSRLCWPGALNQHYGVCALLYARGL